MSNLTNLEFVGLDISGKNYLSWVLDVEMHLNAKGLGETIKENNDASIQDRAKAMIFIRHHLDQGLKDEYLTVKEPSELWKNLKERYDHQRTVILPKARYDWLHLRLQDFKTVSEYNSAMFKISSQLLLCGEKITDDDMLEKTFSTFHASNMVLQQQYREKGFTKYSQLISCLLVAEQNNELLLKNHEARPTGSIPFPEVNSVSNNNNAKGHGRGHSRRRGNGRYRGYNPGSGQNRRGGYNSKNKNYHRKGESSGAKHDKDKRENYSKRTESICYRCGMTGHWERVCHTSKHFVDLYQASLKGKANIESNNVFMEDDFVDTQLDVEDYLGPVENLN
ncbi:uncharacterized protein LOC116010051 [Ipomoea triloba]|uniref:uncharacterized protein LOC115998773 n=1 Tax=Ipomoea triloba TaxID=35885 RepID=UPI00125E4FEF|nr:uncharacterized protein LOC115998773 [Ipomoea triloba]XP_031105173.1 uncharacterized protein LOC116010050 [Ipomoea triloba]XP_031105174.1 uncharacterized protein LOC116010051 [Ipomoea triloba]